MLHIFLSCCDFQSAGNMIHQKSRNEPIEVLVFHHQDGVTLPSDGDASHLDLSAIIAASCVGLLLPPGGDYWICTTKQKRQHLLDPLTFAS